MHIVSRLIGSLVVIAFVLGAGYSYRSSLHLVPAITILLPACALAASMYFVPASAILRWLLLFAHLGSLVLWLATNAWLFGENLDIGALAMRTLALVLLLYFVYLEPKKGETDLDNT